MSDKGLGEVLAKLRASASDASRSLYDAMVAQLERSGALSKALKVGDSFPDFQLASGDGKVVSLQQLLKSGPAVITFYRGAWCPWCTAQLHALARALPKVQAAGASLAVISPEAGGQSLQVQRDLGLDVLSDLDLTLAFACGIVFPVPENVKAIYLDKGIDLARINGNANWFLPAPATFVVGTDGVVKFARVNADFRHRVEPEEVLRALSAL